MSNRVAIKASDATKSARGVDYWNGDWWIHSQSVRFSVAELCAAAEKNPCDFYQDPDGRDFHVFSRMDDAFFELKDCRSNSNL